MIDEEVTAGSKTPVSILNEYLLKRGVTPKFDLVSNQAGTHNPVFVYVIQFGGYKALGSGRSKQKAKHMAAKKMLEYLNVLNETEYKKDAEQLVVPCEKNIDYNAVGVLLDYCKRNFYPEPIYYKAGEAGPPHAKIFTIKCCVSQLYIITEERTIKKAKQLAAHKMLTQLQIEAGEKPMAVAVINQLPFEDATCTTPPKSTSVFQPQSLLYKDYYRAYVGLHEKSETVNHIMVTEDAIKKENALDLVQKIASELAVPLQVKKIGELNTLVDALTDEKENCESKAAKEYANVSTSLELDINCYEPELPLNTESEMIPESELEMSPERISAISNSSKSSHSKKKCNIFISLDLTPPIVSAGTNVTDASINLLNFIKILTIN